MLFAPIIFVLSFLAIADGAVQEMRDYLDGRIHRIRASYTFFEVHTVIGSGVTYIQGNNTEIVKVFFDKKYDVNFNDYFVYEYHLLSWFPKRELLVNDADSLSVYIEYLTPLIFAVGNRKSDIVKAMVEADLKTKLNLLMGHANNQNFTARAVARMIHDKKKRTKMLDLLHVDRNKHDITDINSVLKNDLTVTVREAVFANNIKMVEAALLLKNFGDKKDAEIVGHAIRNGNFFLLNMLLMEGYAAPSGTSIPKIPVTMKVTAGRINSLLAAKIEDRCPPNEIERMLVNS